MQTVTLGSETDFEGWRHAARSLCAAGVPPAGVRFQTPSSPGELFGGDVGLAGDSEASTTAKGDAGAILRVPAPFLELAERAACHADPQRFDRLYCLLWRLQEDRDLLARLADPDTGWLMACDKAIRRDIHKMHAFVRFRYVGESAIGREQFAAWFEPTHRTLRLGAPFFMRRFPGMDWAILTPFERAVWDGESLQFGAGAQKCDAPDTDVAEEHWKAYYAAIFNPARLKIAAMKSEMPMKYWRNLPEAELIPGLIASASQRSRTMTQSAPTVPNLRAQRLVKARRPHSQPDD